MLGLHPPLPSSRAPAPEPASAPGHCWILNRGSSEENSQTHWRHLLHWNVSPGWTMPLATYQNSISGKGLLASRLRPKTSAVSTAPGMHGIQSRSSFYQAGLLRRNPRLQNQITFNNTFFNNNIYTDEPKPKHNIASWATWKSGDCETREKTTCGGLGPKQLQPFKDMGRECSRAQLPLLHSHTQRASCINKQIPYLGFILSHAEQTLRWEISL